MRAGGGLGGGGELAISFLEVETMRLYGGKAFHRSSSILCLEELYLGRSPQNSKPCRNNVNPYLIFLSLRLWFLFVTELSLLVVVGKKEEYKVIHPH